MATAFAKRSPFTPVQKRMNRSNESPMDFAYDAPSTSGANGGSSWLSSEDRKRGRESDVGSSNDAEMKPAFTFGGAEEASSAKQNYGGVFLFHQPLSPTHAGPDVEMDNASPSQARQLSATAAAASTSEGQKEAEASTSSSRPKASGGAVVRVNRRRQFANKARSVSNPLKGSRRPHDGWEDEEDDEEEDDDHRDGVPKARARKRSLARRVGDTLHVNYIIGGGRGPSDAKMGWLDPEWCLG